MCLNSGVTRIDGCLAPCICELGAFQRKRNNRLALEAYTKAKKEPVIVPPNPPPTSASLHAQWMLTPAETEPIGLYRKNRKEPAVTTYPNCKSSGCSTRVLEAGDICDACTDAEEARASRAYLAAKPLPPFLIYAIGYACGVLSMVLVAVVKGWL